MRSQGRADEATRPKLGGRPAVRCRPPPNAPLAHEMTIGSVRARSGPARLGPPPSPQGASAGAAALAPATRCKRQGRAHHRRFRTRKHVSEIPSFATHLTRRETPMERDSSPTICREMQTAGRATEDCPSRLLFGATTGSTPSGRDLLSGPRSAVRCKAQAHAPLAHEMTTGSVRAWSGPARLGPPPSPQGASAGAAALAPATRCKRQGRANETTAIHGAQTSERNPGVSPCIWHTRELPR